MRSDICTGWDSSCGVVVSNGFRRDSERSPTILETAGGMSSQVGSGTPDAEVLLEVGEGLAKTVGPIPASPKVAGGSFSSGGQN
jgi:hypothetical protein